MEDENHQETNKSRKSRNTFLDFRYQSSPVTVGILDDWTGQEMNANKRTVRGRIKLRFRLLRFCRVVTLATVETRQAHGWPSPARRYELRPWRGIEREQRRDDDA